MTAALPTPVLKLLSLNVQGASFDCRFNGQFVSPTSRWNDENKRRRKHADREATTPRRTYRDRRHCASPRPP
jgi:hypothetical protein